MTTKTKSLSVVLAILAVPWGLATVGLAGRASWPRQGKKINTALEIDAAYCDGFFLGGLDARQGRRVQPSIGRWNSEKDRSAFKTGYENGYREALNSRSPEQRH
jgi:hypothetical protein